ncbi:MAG: ABC-F family ATP-binding cassette domain-containing protein [Oscillospiraceae bacterium]|nr:ABC-F family ATP-binding cassette domain-containing protein [Oscillospiraceae bacterium]
MIDISLNNIRKSFGGVEVLKGVTFDVNEGERVALLGANGTGKTTLLRILTGALEPDEGTVSLPARKRVGLISQIPVYPAGYTTEDVLRSAHRHLDALREQMSALEAAMAGDASPAVLSRYDALAADYERLGGYSADYERERIANGLDIGAAMRSQLFDSLSGGEKTRVNLARLLLEDTDILLLDEPTNHLDLKSTEWLEEFLLRFKGTVLTVSHDRWFLDTVAQRTIELVDGKCEFYSGNYSFFVQEKQRRYAELLAQYEKNQKEIAHLQAAADKLHKRAFSMEKRIAKLQTAPRPKTERKLKSRFREEEFRGDEVMLIEGLSKSYGDKRLFSGLELLMEAGERIAVMGDNGTGKSTLVKIILGEETPDDGYVRLGPAVKTAYLPQLVTFSHPQRSALDTLIYDCKAEPQEARDRLAAFNFTGEDVFKTVGSLSGGEQSRLRLCMLMKSDVNLLILDEPTNHLDIMSREWIEQALADYGGALLFVSHDRWFVDAFATRVWELKDGTLSDFRGGYPEYRAYKQRQQEFSRAAKKQDAGRKPESAKKPPRPKNTAREAERTEREIEKLERQITALTEQEEQYATNYQKLLELGGEKAALQEALDDLYLRWEALTE